MGKQIPEVYRLVVKLNKGTDRRYRVREVHGLLDWSLSE
jgi:hypothetical protein